MGWEPAWKAMCFPYRALGCPSPMFTLLEKDSGQHFWGLPRSLSSKESTCNAGDASSIAAMGRSPGERNGNPIQYSSLGNPMDRGAWWATVHGLTKRQTQLSNSTTTITKPFWTLRFLLGLGTGLKGTKVNSRLKDPNKGPSCY